MTYISKLNLSAFKGRTRSHAFAPGVNLICANNGSGKTTICEAITFALSGKVPGLPKTNQGIMDALGSSLRLGAAVSIGNQTYDRALIRSGKSVKGEAKNPAPADLLPPVMLDLEPFLAASPAKRGGMILDACGDGMSEKLRAILAESGLQKGLGSFPKMADTLPEWIANVEEMARTTASAITANIKDMRGTLSGMEILEEALPITLPDITAARAEVSRLEREIASLEGEARALAGRRLPIAPPGERPNGTAEMFETQALAARSALTKAQAELARVKSATSARIRWEAQRGMCEQRLADAIAEFNRLGWDGEMGPTLVELEAEEKEALSEYNTLNARLVSLQTNSLTGKAECPCCRAPREAWGVESEDGEGLEKAIQATREAANKVATASKATVKAKMLDTSSKAVLQAQQSMEDYDRSAPEVVTESVEDLTASTESLAEDAESLATSANLARAWDAYDIAQEESNTYAVKSVELGSQVAILSNHLTAAQAALAQAELAHQAHAQVSARQATRQQAAARLAELEKQEVEFKAARQAWQEGYQTAMDEALRDVLKVCQTFTEGLFPSPLTVHNLALGRYEDKVWVPYDAFSGSDKRIAAAAIQAALAVRHTGFKLVLIDEATTIDPARLPVALANLGRAVEAGLVDQCLVFCNQDMAGVPEGVNVIRLD